MEGSAMAQTVGGVVKGGVVVPDAPLPEGARVEIAVAGGVAGIPPELLEEFEAWDRASAQALELVEQLAKEAPPDEKR
jgi:hypothetical protein